MVATPAAPPLTPSSARGAANPAWANGGRARKKGGGSTHLERDAFRSISFSSKRALRVAPFERVRRSATWRSVVRAKGFLTFAECEGYALTYQQAGIPTHWGTNP